MLIGAALAIIWTPWRLTRDTAKRAPLLLDLMSIVGVVGVVWFFLNAGEFENWMYRGGFLLLAIFAALLIAATVHPASRLSPKVFALPVVVWVGVRSYGIYLWHWPVYMVTRPHADVPLTGIPLLGLRVALTFVFAALSYKYVEEPIRHGALGRRWGEFRRAKGERRRQLATGFAVAGSALVAGILVIAAGFARGRSRHPGRRACRRSRAVVLRPTTTTVAATPNPSGATTTTVASAGGTTDPSATTTTTAAPVAAAHVTAVGDSVMLGAAPRSRTPSARTGSSWTPRRAGSSRRGSTSFRSTATRASSATRSSCSSAPTAPSIPKTSIA